MYRYIGAYTALTLKKASRINPLTDDSALPVTNYVSLDNVNGNSVEVAGRRNVVILIVNNTSGVNALTVTQKTHATISGIVLPDEATVIAAGAVAIIGPIDEGNMLTNETAQFDFAGTSPQGKIMAMEVVQNNA